MSERRPVPEGMSDFSEDARNIERLLRSLEPRASRINRDRLMFLAGEASAVSQRSRLSGLHRLVWPVTAACAAFVGLALGIWFARDHGPAVANAQRTSPDANVTPVDVHERSNARTQVESFFPTNVSERANDAARPTDRPPTLLALRDQVLANRFEESSISAFPQLLHAASGVRQGAEASYRELRRRSIEDNERL
jgi:hypothetical protein